VLLRCLCCRYWADWTAPRPESYREDAELARNVTGTSSPDDDAAAALYRDLASGAESGWDYSSRWFADNKTLATIRTTQVIWNQEQWGCGFGPCQEREDVSVTGSELLFRTLAPVSKSS
jgi:neutral trehalase